MLRWNCLLLIGLIFGSAVPSQVSAQVSGQGLLSAEAAQRAGLTRMWFTHLQMDSSRGKLQGLTHHVSATRSHTEFEVSFRGRSYVFSERDLDAFGNPIGVDGAKTAAQKKLAQLTLAAAPAPAAGANEAPDGAAAPPPAAKDAPKMLMHVIPEITIYATSQRGMVHAIDGETGKTKWSSYVGDPRFPTSNAGASDDVVAVFNGSTVYVLKASDGTPSWERPIRGAPVEGPAVTEDFVFVPLLTGVVEAYWVDFPKRAASTFRALGHPTTQPVLLNRSIAWATDRGHVYVASASAAKLKYRVETNDNVVSIPGFLPPDKLFATSQDGYIYCIRETRGGIAWKFSTGESISLGPIGVHDTVYAISDLGTLFAVDATAGVERWTTGGIRGFIAATRDRLYCTDLTANLVVLDSRSGARVASIAAPSLEVRMVNSETDRIVVGTPSGLLQCFRELDKKWPEVRMMHDGGPRPQKAPAKSAGPEMAKPATEEVMPMAEEDPFAKPAAGAKPPAAAEMPPAEGAPAEADPFGETKGEKK